MPSPPSQRAPGRPNLSRPIPRFALNETELAIALGVGVSTVRDMVEAGRLPRPKLWGRRRLYLVTEIDAALLEWPTDGEEDGSQGATDDDRWSAQA